MKWKIKESNFIVACLFSFAYTIVTLLVIIGPLHMNSTGNINSLDYLSLNIVFYWLGALVLNWSLYLWLRKKPEILFFTLILLGMAVIVLEVFIWAWVGS